MSIDVDELSAWGSRRLLNSAARAAAKAGIPQHEVLEAYELPMCDAMLMPGYAFGHRAQRYVV